MPLPRMQAAVRLSNNYPPCSRIELNDQGLGVTVGGGAAVGVPVRVTDGLGVPVDFV